MSFLLEGYNWVLALMALTSGALLFAPMLRGATGGGISTAEAVRLINREKGVLIDVCEPDEYAAGHAGGARSVPLSQLAATIESGKGLPTNKTLPVIVMCATGARSARAVLQLRKAGWEKAVSVSGGNAAWREATLPIEKSA